MKNITLFLAIIFLSLGYTVKAQTEDQKVSMCTKKAGADASFLKEMIADIPAVTGSEKIPDARLSMILRKNIKYRVTICTDDDSPGKGYVEMYDNTTLIGTSFVKSMNQDMLSFEFDCQKAGAYHFFVKFHDGKAGKAVMILSFVKTL
jgi:hypothetical protein